MSQFAFDLLRMHVKENAKMFDELLEVLSANTKLIGDISLHVIKLEERITKLEKKK